MAYIARLLASVRALTPIAQVSTQRTLHCAIIRATRNVQRNLQYLHVQVTSRRAAWIFA